jgi:hypothetical protein
MQYTHYALCSPCTIHCYSQAKIDAEDRKKRLAKAKVAAGCGKCAPCRRGEPRACINNDANRKKLKKGTQAGKEQEPPWLVEAKKTKARLVEVTGTSDVASGSVLPHGAHGECFTLRVVRSWQQLQQPLSRQKSFAAARFVRASAGQELAPSKVARSASGASGADELSNPNAAKADVSSEYFLPEFGVEDVPVAQLAEDPALRYRLLKQEAYEARVLSRAEIPRMVAQHRHGGAEVAHEEEEEKEPANEALMLEEHVRALPVRLVTLVSAKIRLTEVADKAKDELRDSDVEIAKAKAKMKRFAKSVLPMMDLLRKAKTTAAALAAAKAKEAGSSGAAFGDLMPDGTSMFHTPGI